MALAYVASRASPQIIIITTHILIINTIKIVLFILQPWPERRPRHIWPAELPLEDQHGASAGCEDGQQHKVKNMMMGVIKMTIMIIINSTK